MDVTAPFRALCSPAPHRHRIRQVGAGLALAPLEPSGPRMAMRSAGADDPVSHAPEQARVMYVGAAPADALRRVLGRGVHVPAPAGLEALPLAAERPDVLVLGTDRWAWHAIASLPPESRPAVVAIGRDAASFAAGADEWIADIDDAEEIRERLAIAIERARTRRRVARRAFVDSLTSLPNRRAALRALIRETGRARRNEGTLSLVLLDLDDFKAVNEAGGHAAGDRVLRRVGQVLRAATRADELCARIGGDEFALVIAGDIRAAMRAARRIQSALGRGGVRASAGAAELAHGEGLHELYRRADDDLRAAKAARPRPRAARAAAATPRRVAAWSRRYRRAR